MPTYAKLTVRQFLTRYPRDARHYQLFGGDIKPLARPGIAHQIVAATLAAALIGAARATRPRPVARTQGGVAPRGAGGHDYFETDFTIAREPLNRGAFFAEPLLIVEILSPASERDDIFHKLPLYQELACLREILYVESETQEATLYRRTATGAAAGWTADTLAGRDARIRLDTVALDLPLAALYRRAPWISPRDQPQPRPNASSPAPRYPGNAISPIM